eukprot:13479684-Heterocapsa_arctica.AAC.1
MLSSDVGQLSSGSNFPHQCSRRGESTIIEFDAPLSEFAFPNSHPHSINMRKDGNRAELPLILCTFFANEGNDRMKAMCPPL